MKTEGGGNSTAPLQPAADAASQIAMRTTQGTTPLSVATTQEGIRLARGSAAVSEPVWSVISAKRSLQLRGVDDLRRRLEIAQGYHVGDRDLHALVAATRDIDLRRLPRQRGLQRGLVDTIILAGVEHL